ncbi:COG3650 family protein [Leisingera thetidis]|uniref:COG3650 family protein n=1 Tax=Leisingera thetidis TaxID=2930199 RepID=UPI0021F6B752|nr:SH3 domain-containing protein [Leisingera thetidis]
MRQLAPAALFWLLSTILPALAQDYPALFQVTGVAANDVLNIRSTPSASSPVIGAYSPDQSSIEVVAPDGSGTWGQVNTGETSGWVALRYLTREQAVSEHLRSAPFACFGTEPFWSLNVSPGGTAKFSTPESVGTLDTGELKTAAGRLDRYVLGLASGQAAVIRHETCSDGMSDRVYGLSADLLLQQDGIELLSGCCSLAER